ncbi:glycosyltransferase [Tenacibaculum sp. MAR_2009_124]|uniref:glycosyltransferase n=1 Tax=Tenacibaculum sp. MAR_2009_124 TaxID=1250059 RepID=UPI0015A27CDD|nr:glycosyltransferase [Tenacibaculum sp. MAR_2009_124]
MVQFIYYLFFFTLPFNTKRNGTLIVENKAISIIIYIKNNANELKQNLPSIINQEYKDFEIVLVNHSSSDQSLEIIKHFQQNHHHIKVVNVENKEAFWGNKKYALTLGIKAASNDSLLFFNIDCKPASKLWIKEMASKLDKETSVVIGYKSLKSTKFSVKSLFIRFHNTLSSLKFFTFAKLNNPYKGFQENFGYNRQLFFKVKGFINHINIVNGETDLFLKDSKAVAKTQIQLIPDSYVKEQSIVTFSEFLSDFRKHNALRSFYSGKTRFFLALFNLSKFMFWLSSIYLCFHNLIFGLLAIAIYLLFQYAFITKAMVKLKEVKLLYFLPILDISYVFFVFFSAILNLVSKPKL